jgi:predicted 3-demethylubiquinone-9 3-methyltransferase (glyoxalase superfamily)
MQKITPFLWFDTQAESAAVFYVSIFGNSQILNVTRYGEAGPGPKGSVMTVVFELNGQTFTALNGGPHFKFTEAISFSVDCTTQEEVDKYWERALRRRRTGAMRLAERQIRFVMADQSHYLGRDVE